MFELMRPKKEMVGKRIGAVKEELGVSFTELGDRLGLKKPTINSYVQGYTLAPMEVIEKLAKITGKSVGWFYFGDMEDYIREYLLKKGHEALLLDYPEIPAKLKDTFIGNEDLSWDWKNEFGYPSEEVLDDAFLEIYQEIMKDYIFMITKEYIGTHSTLEKKKQEEVVCLISAEIYETFWELRELQYGDREEIEKSVKLFYEQDVKDKVITFSDEYLVGSLINILGDDRHTADLISYLSVQLTGKGRLNVMFSGKELIEVFQAMRPALIKLYTEHENEEFYDWFEK